MKNFTLNSPYKVPCRIICQNRLIEKSSKLSISTEKLAFQFFSLGYSKIKRTRGVENFEGKREICDIILLELKKNFLFFPSHCPSSELNEKNALQVEVKKLRDHFLRDRKAVELGYQTAEVKLISELKNQEKAAQFIEQGFQICVILAYPNL